MTGAVSIVLVTLYFPELAGQFDALSSGQLVTVVQASSYTTEPTVYVVTVSSTSHVSLVQPTGQGGVPTTLVVHRRNSAASKVTSIRSITSTRSIRVSPGSPKDSDRKEHKDRPAHVDNQDNQTGQ